VFFGQFIASLKFLEFICIPNLSVESLILLWKNENLYNSNETEW